METIFSSFPSLDSRLLNPSLPLPRRPRWPRMDSSVPHHRTNQSKIKLIVLVGATGSGKSRLSIDLASHFPHSQIVNSDKMQLFSGLDITTNKIPLDERRGVPHFLLGEFDSIEADVAASQFRSVAGLTIVDIASRGNLPLLVGGSNTFIHALLVETFDPEEDVFAESGSRSHLLRYDCCFLWVDMAWSVLTEYLCKRVDEMLESGMFEELAQFYDPTKAGVMVGLRKAIGVPEFDAYFRKYPPWESPKNGVVPGKDSDPIRREAYEEAVKEIKDNTCRLAKRQIGKILRLKEAGWDLVRLDATATFQALMKRKKKQQPSSSSSPAAVAAELEWREIWEMEVLEPSVKIVKRFLE
ncbi:Adenylate isopentenyltransferase 1 [Hibiscus syriacus]|uniref:adenylate dimethylallyltransferase (ADP/ATP-dependent) n=1 Tax=Hibiscus syriacus TaxID=106335 RepID=A0A6A3BD53_HIBSY|nr:adenylate isopentenyltransferase-like [Hibiscus syriacus]KAE8713518.1 Adenylate isopentenyltransferase 1 [Hibiscus syriacus]